MATTQAKVIINGEDKTGAAFASAQKNTETFGSSVKKLGKLMGVGLLAAGAGATAFLYSAAKGAAEAESSFARMTTTVNNTFNAFEASKLNEIQKEVNEQFGEGFDIVDAYLENIKDLSAATVKLGFDDEAAAESIAKLFQRTGDLTKANELNNLAMDLARAKNMDLASASGLVGMVMSGNARALKEFGIEIDESKGPMEALAQLQGMVAGQAEAFANTFQGRMLVISESFSNLKDTIGAAVLESITPFIQQLSAWAQDPSTIEMVKNIAAAIGQFASVALPVAIESVMTLAGWFKVTTDFISDMILKVMEAIDALKKLFNTVVNAPKNLGNFVGKSLVNLVTGGADRRAMGGPVSAGSPYIVGENGPELFVPSRSGGIIPNHGLAGGGITINITGNTLLDRGAGERIAEQIMQTLRTNLRI